VKEMKDVEGSFGPEIPINSWTGAEKCQQNDRIGYKVKLEFDSPSYVAIEPCAGRSAVVEIQ
jgi:hypothetical protein